MSYNFEIKSYKKADNGVYLQIFIPDKKILGDIFNYNNELKVASGEIKLDDGRLLTAKQKMRIYLTIKDIANYLGYFESEMEQILIQNFNVSQNEELELIPKASISVARKFLAYLLEFVLSMDIPLSDYALNRIDDLDSFLRLCLTFHKCVLCGDMGEIHHIDQIGLGRDRKKIDDSNHKKICLCRKHHSLAHSMGKIEFCNKYKVHGILYTGN